MVGARITLLKFYKVYKICSHNINKHVQKRCYLKSKRRKEGRNKEKNGRKEKRKVEGKNRYIFRIVTMSYIEAVKNNQINKQANWRK